MQEATLKLTPKNYGPNSIKTDLSLTLQGDSMVISGSLNKEDRTVSFRKSDRNNTDIYNPLLNYYVRGDLTQGGFLLNSLVLRLKVSGSAHYRLAYLRLIQVNFP